MLVPDTNNKKPNKCCIEKNLEWLRSGSCFPYEIWFCKICKSEYDVELIRNFDYKEILR